jgi:hypothetical protein
MTKVGVLVVVALVSCKPAAKDKDKDAGVGGGGGGGTHTTAPAGKPAAATDRMLTCDQAIAKSFRDKWVPDATLKELKLTVPMAVSCQYKFPKDTHPKSLGVDVSVHCLDSIKAAMVETMGYLKKQYPNMHDVSGVGAGAVAMDMPSASSVVNGAVMIVAFDDDSNCKADVTASSELDATAIMKDLLASLPPK